MLYNAALHSHTMTRKERSLIVERRLLLLVWSLSLPFNKGGAFESAEDGSLYPRTWFRPDVKGPLELTGNTSNLPV